MGGFRGKMLAVNLSGGTTGTSVVDKDTCRKFIGGSGLAAKLLLDRVPPDVDPLSPDTPLFIVSGPVSGTGLAGGAHFSVCTKPPLTNMFAETSCGGDFVWQLRSAGWEGIIVEGAADKPVYLVIEDNKVEIKDASDLWGKNVYELTGLLKDRHGDSKRGTSLTIGVAGENLVKFALIANGTRNFASRCGVGAVMGSKKLKAIFVKGKWPGSSRRQGWLRNATEGAPGEEQGQHRHPDAGNGRNERGTLPRSRSPFESLRASEGFHTQYAGYGPTARFPTNPAHSQTTHESAVHPLAALWGCQV